MTGPVATVHVGGLPLDHPVTRRLVAANVERAAQVVDKPVNRYPIMGLFLDAERGLAALSPDQHEMVWLCWVDPLPPAGVGQAAGHGWLHLAVSWQTGGRVITSGASTNEPRPGNDPQPGDFSSTAFKTARRKRMRLADDSILDVPIWRLHRRDQPHDPVCTEACAECGTLAYWDLPEFVWPAPTMGIADQDNPSRVSVSEKVMYGLGSTEVVLTDHARFAWGWIGIPHKREIGRIVALTEKPDRDVLIVRWNDRDGSESVVTPTEVQRP